MRFDYGGVFFQTYGLGADLEYEQYYDSFYDMVEGCGIEDISDENAIDFGYDNVLSGARYDFKVSMYLDMPSTAYTRTLTQGVTLNDTRRTTGAYKKTLAMNGRNTMSLGHGSSYVRKHTATVKGTDLLNRFVGIFRKLTQQIVAGELLTGSRALLRIAIGAVKSATVQRRFAGNKRNVTETGKAVDGGNSTKRGIFRTMPMSVKESDSTGRMAGLWRSLAGTVAASDTTGYWGDYVRGLYVTAGNHAETVHEGDYHREAFDTAEVSGVPLRSLGIFIKLVTVGFIRDYLLWRFLKSNEELVVKSPLCRELVLESKIH
jgi:hypothetical protein